MRHAIPIITGALLVVLPLAAPADTPDVEPGEWEFTTTIDMRGGQRMPEQSHTSQQCITEKDLAEAESTFLDDVGDCTVMDSDISAETMEFTMSCDQQGMQAHVTGEYTFMGDTAEGNMVFDMNPAAAPGGGPGAGPGAGDDTGAGGGMQILTEIHGERIGDC